MKATVVFKKKKIIKKKNEKKNVACGYSVNVCACLFVFEMPHDAIGFLKYQVSKFFFNFRIRFLVSFSLEEEVCLAQ